MRKVLKYLWWGVLAGGAIFILIWRTLQRATALGAAAGKAGEQVREAKELPKDQLDSELKRRLKEL